MLHGISWILADIAAWDALVFWQTSSLQHISRMQLNCRSKVFGVGSVCKHLGQNKLIPRPHLGGHASCIRAGLTPTFPIVRGWKLAPIPLCMLSLSAAAGGSYIMGVSLQKKRGSDFQSLKMRKDSPHIRQVL